MSRSLLLVIALLAGCAQAEIAPPVAATPVELPAIEAASLLAGPGERLGQAPEQIERLRRERPPSPAFTATYRAALFEDSCTDRTMAAPVADEITLTILDRSYALPPDYAPADLVSVAQAGFAGGAAGQLVTAAVLGDLAAMREASVVAGLQVQVQSAYRSYAEQAVTFGFWAGQLGNEGALVRAASPGHSEHQLGTAIDFTSAGWSDGRFGDWALETVEGAWLVEHAWEYGFAMSYPAGSQATTCFSYEPWHYRWIGRGPAAEWHAGGLPLRTFLERYVIGEGAP